LNATLCIMISVASVMMAIDFTTLARASMTPCNGEGECPWLKEWPAKYNGVLPTYLPQIFEVQRYQGLSYSLEVQRYQGWITLLRRNATED
jgi:hypothetical protein